LGAVVQIPVTIKIENIKVIRRGKDVEPEENERNSNGENE